MLTADIIKQSEALSDLPDEKIQALVTLAQNVFKEEIDTYAGTTKRRWEEDIKSLYGADKPDPKMPAHEFLKTAWQERERKFKEELEAAKSNPTGVEEIKAEYERKRKQLEDEMKEAALRGSSLLKEEVAGYQTKVKDYEALVAQLKKDHKHEISKFETELLNERKGAMMREIVLERDKAIAGIDFKAGLDKDEITDIVDARWGKILSEYTPERVQNERGETVTIWRDKDGQVARNLKNNREPYTTQELITERLESVVKQGRTQGGAGTSGGNGGAPGTSLNLNIAKTQVEADDMIANFLMSKGLARTNPEYQKQFTQIRQDNSDLYKGAKALPMM